MNELIKLYNRILTKEVAEFMIADLKGKHHD